MSNSNQSRIRTKPDPLHDFLDLVLDLRAILDIFQLSTQTEEANLKHQPKLASWYEVCESGTVISGSSVFLA